MAPLKAWVAGTLAPAPAASPASFPHYPPVCPSPAPAPQWESSRCAGDGLLEMKLLYVAFAARWLEEASTCALVQG